MLNQKKGAYRRLFLFLVFLLPASAQAGSGCETQRFDETARVSYVHDGDTVHLEDGRKVRLIGINAPELARDERPAQAFSREARDSLSAALSSQNYRVGLIYGVERHDRYQRTLAHLFTPDGDNLQAHLLRQGLAAAITHPPNTVYSSCYSRQEKTARCNGAGIWSKTGHIIHQAADLDRADKGFHLVTGVAEQVSQTDRGVWIVIADLLLGIRDKDLPSFDLAELHSLQGKRLTVRGWLHPASAKQNKQKFLDGRKVEYYMRIRHPSAIEINQAGTGTNC